jgi:hypothetical protein
VVAYGIVFSFFPLYILQINSASSTINTSNIKGGYLLNSMPVDPISAPLITKTMFKSAAL